MTRSTTKIVVLGDSCVGKSTFVATLCKQFDQYHPSTVGALLSMTWHDYRSGTTEQKLELIELWDIGGRNSHKQASSILMEGAAGVILVHDVTNIKSEAYLGAWLTLLNNGERLVKYAHSMASLQADIEATQIPILIVGAKMDLAPHRATPSVPTTAPRMYLDVRKEIVAGSSNAMILSRFFDAAIHRTRSYPPMRRKMVFQ